MKNWLIFVVAGACFAATNVSALGYSKSGGFDLDLNGAKRVRISMVGLPRPKIQYVKTNENVAKFLFSVISASPSGADPLLSGDVGFADDEIKVSRYGSYACELSKRNGVVTHIKGSCYEQVIIRLPLGSRVEVYNNDDRLTDVFIPIANQELIDSTFGGFDDGKIKLVDNFLRSYANAKLTPQMSAQELGKVLDHFSFSKNTLIALGKLHRAVTDRESLPKMIDDVFPFSSDKEAARKIVGIK